MTCNLSNVSKDKKANELWAYNSWVGVDTALGAAVLAVTKDPVWVGVGVAVGAALGWRGFKARQKSD